MRLCGGRSQEATIDGGKIGKSLLVSYQERAILRNLAALGFHLLGTE